MTQTTAGATSVPWQSFTPVFADAAGRVEEGRPSRAEVSPERIACFLGRTAVMRDHAPTSPWARLHRVPVRRPVAPDVHTDPGELAERFAAAVGECAGDAGTVAVAVSGGIDSLAVVAAAAAGGDRRVVAVTSDAVDGLGRSPARLVAAQLDALAAAGGHAPVELLVVPYDLSASPLPRWRQQGPRFHATPREQTALAAAAAGRGAGVLLHGGGADQLLAFPTVGPAALRPLTAALRRRASRAYEGGASVADRIVRLRSSRAARAFWATQAAPRYARCAGPAMLAPAHATAVESSYLTFAADQLAHHVEQGWGIHRAALFERLYPHDALPPATALPLRSPFYVPDFADYAWRLPMRSRWDPAARSPYHCAKALLVGLVPGPARSALPDSTMLSVRHAVDYWRGETVTPELLLRHGILRPDWRSLARSVYDIQMVAECEHWLAHALEGGARMLPAGGAVG